MSYRSKNSFVVGVFRDGKLLFTLCPNQPTMARAEFACSLFEALGLEKKLCKGDYIAFDYC